VSASLLIVVASSHRRIVAVIVRKAIRHPPAYVEV
jgi:hypothetical protein